MRKSYRLMVRAWPEASLGEGGARAGRRNRNKGRRGGRSIVGRRSRDMARAGAWVGERAVVRSCMRSRDKAGAAAKAAAGATRKSYRLMVRAWAKAILGEEGARVGMGEGTRAKGE
jgi:hypothetical protein